ncbi:MAG: carboxypeptidase-like regulatory domain-containing protein, partial [Bacteroidales bacterium]|nr:carboxypeptidase-like regulatory domain-containing protein [Bacteroidales bacterium]
MKAITWLLTCLILTFNYTAASAQNYEIRGKITDNNSGGPMVGVHIAIKNDVYGTISGNDGDFVLKTHRPPPFVLHISYVGYVPQDIEVKDETTFLDIKMEEQMLLGQEVVISA